MQPLWQRGTNGNLQRDEQVGSAPVHKGEGRIDHREDRSQDAENPADGAEKGSIWVRLLHVNLRPVRKPMREVAAQ